MAPAAPARLSTMIGCLSEIAILSASTRPAMSVEPPAGNGIISVIGFAGKSWASAVANVPAMAATNARADTAQARRVGGIRRVTEAMAFLLFWNASCMTRDDL